MTYCTLYPCSPALALHIPPCATCCLVFCLILRLGAYASLDLPFHCLYMNCLISRTKLFLPYPDRYFHYSLSFRQKKNHLSSSTSKDNPSNNNNVNHHHGHRPLPRKRKNDQRPQQIHAVPPHHHPLLLQRPRPYPNFPTCAIHVLLGNLRIVCGASHGEMGRVTVMRSCCFGLWLRLTARDDNSNDIYRLVFYIVFYMFLCNSPEHLPVFTDSISYSTTARPQPRA